MVVEHEFYASDREHFTRESDGEVDDADDDRDDGSGERKTIEGSGEEPPDRQTDDRGENQSQGETDYDSAHEDEQ